uniref:SCP domain-containing protein n=1 Tax=Ciona savignyi TaxID=51511 RepID=H2YZD6_CIOSA
MSGKGGEKVETKVSTKVEQSTDEKGRKVQKTTKTTVTTTTKNGSKSTSTKTEVKTEYVGGEAPSTSGKSKDKPLTDGLSNLSVKGGSKLSSSEKKKFRDEALSRHNTLRARHRVPPLRRSSKLEDKAQEWAERLLKQNKMEHRPNNEHGENVAFKFASDKTVFPGDVITDMWYDEIHKYNFRDPGFKSGTGHFTQVVWKNSTEIGIGVATDGKGTLFAVANYAPAGNFRGQFEENVPKPKK